MLKVHLLSVGKTKESWLDEALAEYIKRLQPILEISCTWLKNDQDLLVAIEKERLVIGLDPNGKLMTSELFSGWLYKKFQEGGSRICLVIGGADGLPASFKKSYELISLSPLTMTHQLTRLVLAEQIYRATEIEKGSPYHK